MKHAVEYDDPRKTMVPVSVNKSLPPGHNSLPSTNTATGIEARGDHTSLSIKDGWNHIMSSEEMQGASDLDRTQQLRAMLPISGYTGATWYNRR